MRRVSVKENPTAPILERLEPRMLLSAAWDVVLIDAQLPQSLELVRAASGAEQIVVYDSRQDSATNVLARATELVLSADRRMASLSILSHGAPGGFALGSDWISLSNIEATASAWADLGESMVDGADIYLYACNIAAPRGPGRELLNSLAELTGADVFASDDLTGAGGDWVLEAASSGDEAELAAGLSTPFDMGMLSEYQFSLDPPAITVRDEFNAVSYAGNDGTQNWTGDWQEIAESDGASSGYVQVETSRTVVSGNCLSIEIDTNTPGVSRQADLTGAISATLSFWYEQDHVANNGTIDLEVHDGASWNLLQTYSIDSDITTAQYQSFDITAYAATNTQIRFLTTSGIWDYFYIDDVQIEYTTNAGPAITARETVDSDGNGQIDQIKITASEALDDDFSGLTITVDGYAVTGYSSDIANDNIFYVNLTESGSADTDATPTVTVTANTTLSEFGGSNNIAVDSSWLDANWLNRTRIRFDNLAQTTDDLDDFPVLVTISTANLTSLDLSAVVGADVRFTDAISGDELKYEVESWDADADTATIWVKVPRIDKASNSDYIYAYYNYNGTATYDQSAADEQAVWNSNYKGVFHLNEDVVDEATSSPHVDSTGTNVNADQAGNVEGAGRIADGQLFDTDDYINVGGLANDIDVTKGTVSVWTELNTTAAERRLFSAKVDPQNNIEIFWDDAGDNLTIKYKAGAVISQAQVFAGPVFDEGDGKQHLVTLTWDTAAGASGEVKAFVDGAQVDTTRTGLGTWIGAINDYVSIGSSGNSAHLEQWDGMIDEVRVSSTARSADWIAASFKSQNGTFAFNNFGSEEDAVTPGVASTDKAAPTVAITRDDASPTNANSVVFSVDFSEDVANVDAADFTLALAGVTANATVTVGDAGDADDSTYTVTVDTIAGDGTLGLDIAGGNNIVDLAGNALNTTPTADEVYTIDNTVPTAAITLDDASPTNANSVVFSVDFSEDVANVDAADFTLALAGVTANATVTVEDAGDADDSTYTVTVDTIAGDGTLGLDIAGGNNIVDLAGNALNTTPTADEVYTIDNTVPTAAITLDEANPTNANSVVFSVDFSEDVANVDAADFTLALAGVTANATVTVGDAGDADDSTYTVTVDTIAGDGTLGLDIAGGNNIVDLVGNALNTTPTIDEIYTIDNTVPTAAITLDDASPTNANSVVFSVDFSEDVANVDAADFTLALAGVTANATVTVGDAGDADDSTHTVTVDTIAGDGTLGLDIAGGNNIVDLAANHSTPHPPPTRSTRSTTHLRSLRRPTPLIRLI